MLFCENMEDNEAILIQGAEQFSEYRGYGGRFTYAGPYTDTNPINHRRIRCVSIVAIDAIPQDYYEANEFSRHSIARELDKAYCGFSFTIANDNPASKELRPVATGNWGCGAFGGNKALKTLIQWMSATMAGRQVKYYSFRDRTFSQRQNEVAKVLQDRKVSVGKLYNILVSSSEEMEKQGVFKYIMEKVAQI